MVGTETLEENALAAWLGERRWFGSKSRGLAGAEVIATPIVDERAPRLRIALVEARFEEGPGEIYQVPLVERVDDLEVERSGGDQPDRRAEEGRIAAFGAEGSWGFDALADHGASDRLLELFAARAEVETDEGRVDFRWVGEPVPAGARARPLGAEQSNSSVVFGENAILKVYRRLESGLNPELEMLRFLGDHGFEQIPRLLGWYEYGGPALGATLGVVGEFVADGRDGWELTLDGLAGGGDSMLPALGELGATVGRMHGVLGGDPGDAAFAPERRDAASVAALAAEIDREIERVFASLPDDKTDRQIEAFSDSLPAAETDRQVKGRSGSLAADEPTAAIAGRGEELRELVRGLAEIGDAGAAIRIHGDLHLGQVLRSDRGWTVLDFEGEPARPLAERRAKHSPLRDVAGVLRSFAYAPAAVAMRGDEAPDPEWEGRAREVFLDAYLGAVDPALLPAERADLERLLALHELEKVVYELRYELDHRPDWVAIPVAGIARLLDNGVA